MKAISRYEIYVKIFCRILIGNHVGAFTLVVRDRELNGGLSIGALARSAARPPVLYYICSIRVLCIMY